MFSRISITSVAFFPLVASPFFSSASNGEATPSTSITKKFLIASEWRSAHVITTLTIGGILLVLFGVWEAFGPHSMIPGSIFGNKVFCAFLYQLTN